MSVGGILHIYQVLKQVSHKYKMLRISTQWMNRKIKNATNKRRFTVSDVHVYIFLLAPLVKEIFLGAIIFMPKAIW